MSENVTDVKYEGILDVTLTDFYAIISDSTETVSFKNQYLNFLKDESNSTLRYILA